MAQINKYSRVQILLSGHMDRFAYLRIRKLRFALGLDQVQSLRIRKFCIYAKVEKLRSRGQMCNVINFACKVLLLLCMSDFSIYTDLFSS